MSESPEKRRAPRLNRRFILRAALSGEKPLRWSFVTIHNLSATGIFFTYEKNVRVGTKFHFKIDFPDRVIECMGCAVRLCGIREGIYQDVAAQLEEMADTDRLYIEEFTRRNP